jgi:RNase P/RNase MRP subunit p30
LRRDTPKRQASVKAEHRLRHLYEVRRIKLSNSIAAHQARQAFLAEQQQSRIPLPAKHSRPTTTTTTTQSSHAIRQPKSKHPVIKQE